MKFTEKVLVVSALCGYVCKWLHLGGGFFLMALSMMLLSSLYFAFSFLLLNDIRFRDMFKLQSYAGKTTQHLLVAIIAGISNAMLVTSLMLKLGNWLGSNVLFFPGIILGIMNTGALLLSKDPDLSPLKRNTLYRLVPLMLVAATAYVFLYS